MIVNKSVFFSDFEILEICGQVNHEEYAQEEPAERTETKNITESNNTKSKLTQDERNRGNKNIHV